MPSVISSGRERDRFLVSFASSHHRPRHSGHLVGKRDGRDLGGSPRQQRGEPGPMFCAMDFGVADDGKRADGEQVPDPRLVYHRAAGSLHRIDARP
jgi:hypothetical protein